MTSDLDFDKIAAYGSAMNHALRIEFLSRAARDSISPVAAAKANRDEGDLGTVSYHVSTLLDLGCVEEARTRPRQRND